MNIKKILILLIFAIAIAGIIAPASAAIDSADNNKVLSIESKEKTVNNKITWNANGGKIGTKSAVLTNVKKGSKIGKFPTTPTKHKLGFKFAGWYTKRFGGTKITTATKIQKNARFFAQWKTPTKFIGTWTNYDDGASGDFRKIIYRPDGSFEMTRDGAGFQYKAKGSYSKENNGVIISNLNKCESRHFDYQNRVWGPWKTDNTAILLGPNSPVNYQPDEIIAGSRFYKRA